jgi:hypothetical protein
VTRKAVKILCVFVRRFDERGTRCFFANLTSVDIKNEKQSAYLFAGETHCIRVEATRFLKVLKFKDHILL